MGDEARMTLRCDTNSSGKLVDKPFIEKGTQFQKRGGINMVSASPQHPQAGVGSCGVDPFTASLGT